jgi:capsular polysaccharide biosynthesis protein
MSVSQLTRIWQRRFKDFIKPIILTILHRLPIDSTIYGPPSGFWRTTRLFISYLQLTSPSAKYIEIYSSYLIRRIAPQSPYSEVDWRFKDGYLGSEFTTPSAFVAVVPDGRVCGANGAIIAPDDKLLFDVSLQFFVDDPENHPILRAMRLPTVVKLDARVAVLAVDGGHNYFHWMFDLLPRAHLLTKSNVICEVDKFVINSLEYSFQRETLEVLGISQQILIEADDSLHLQATKLIVPSLPGISGSVTRWACDFLRETFLGSTVDNNGKFERIYISRSTANSRRIVNESELIQMLRQFGFKVLTMEKSTVLEQAAIMAAAKIVIAVHGAALTNLVFCSTGCRVIEIFPPRYVNPCYRGLCSLLNLDYWYMLGKGEKLPVDFEGNHLAAGGKDDVEVDIDDLVRTLADMGIDNTQSGCSVAKRASVV